MSQKLKFCQTCFFWDGPSTISDKQLKFTSLCRKQHRYRWLTRYSLEHKGLVNRPARRCEDYE